MIYFIQESGNKRRGAVKIGFTQASDAMRRLRALQTGNPRRLVLRAIYAGDWHVEGELHYHFRSTHRHFGGAEWFSWSEELERIIIGGLAEWRKQLEDRELADKRLAAAITAVGQCCRQCGATPPWLVRGLWCELCADKARIATA